MSISRHIRGVILPLLVIIYPVIFLFCRNIQILELANLGMPLLIAAAFALIIYSLLDIFMKDEVAAGNAAVIIIAFFYTYGSIYHRLVSANRFQVEHYTLLPLILVVAIYIAYFVANVREDIARTANKILMVISAGLILFNIASASPAIIKKVKVSTTPKNSAVVSAKNTSQYPDIYFIILDEYAGFDAVQGYWHDDYYKGFESFLEQNHFYVAQHVYSKTTSTLVEVASRLNMKEYPPESSLPVLFDAIAHNRLMSILKSYGYSTVVFDGAKTPYPAKTDIAADYNLTFDMKSSDAKGVVVDEFSEMLLDKTMLTAFSYVYRENDAFAVYSRAMTLFALNKTANLPEVKSPKFVYSHILLPHLPIIFDENGHPMDRKNYWNWNYYLGQHKFASKEAQLIISQLLKNADPSNPPIIILQSDHGARNVEINKPDGVLLKNYPTEYRTNILDAMYLPNFDYSQFPQKIDPTETFALILKHYFNYVAQGDLSTNQAK